MRKYGLLALALALLLALAGCSSLVPSEYTQVSLHTQSAPEQEQPGDEPRIVSTQEELLQAIGDFIGAWTQHGVIRVYSYPGDVEADLPDVIYQATREDPYGAYVVDYITHSCSLIVSYYEITLDITYRPEAVAREQLTPADNTMTARTSIEHALDRYESRLVLDVAYYIHMDVDKIVQDYCAARPAQQMAAPQVTAELYPESGTARILDLRFSYPQDADTLLEMEQAVEDSLNAASVYVRYRENEQEKAELLFTYLMERFTYESAFSSTPVYSFLCEGVADSQSAAVSWQLLCDKAGLQCHTVSGLRAGSEYWWNILSLDGVWYHVDIFRNLLESETLQTWSDSAMTDYYWDAANYPVCPDPELPPEPVLPQNPDQSGGETPADPQPPADPGDAPAEAQPPEASDPPAGQPADPEPAPEE